MVNRTLFSKLIQFVVVCVVCGWTPGQRDLGAHELLGVEVSAALRIAVTGLGPAPLGTILPPEMVDRVGEEIQRRRWTLPELDESRWPIADEVPVVETRRKDEYWHEVRAGHTLKRIRQMYRISTDALAALNPQVDLHNLEPGTRLLIWQRDAQRFARSVGAANRGRILDAEPLPPGESYIVLYPHRAWGTYYTISEIVRVLDAYGERYPEADPLIVGDISFRTGRSIHPHRSHQAGRDVDITYPRLRPPPNYNRFHHVRRDNLDVEKTLWLLKQFIDGGQVEYMFVDRYHQRQLRREAERQGAPQEWLDAVFQYPAHSGGTAIIRHARGHAKHFHVRFKCQPTDRRCQ